MSSSQSVLQHGGGHGGRAFPAGPRVRDRARGAMAVMAFSAATSGSLAGALLLLGQLGR